MNLYITYNRSDAGQGRKVLEDGKWILYAGNQVPNAFDTFLNEGENNRRMAEASLETLADEADKDIEAADTIFVYVGYNAKDASLQLIDRLLSRGKKVVMTACDCSLQEKTSFADCRGIRIITTPECGGAQLLPAIMRGELAAA